MHQFTKFLVMEVAYMHDRIYQNFAILSLPLLEVRNYKITWFKFLFLELKIDSIVRVSEVSPTTYSVSGHWTMWYYSFIINKKTVNTRQLHLKYKCTTYLHYFYRYSLLTLSIL